MRFSQIFSNAARKCFSLEFFPPRSEDSLAEVKRLMQTLAEQEDAPSPNFYTITYGAGGGSRNLTRELVSFACKHFDFPAAAHLTCAAHSRGEIDAILDELHQEGVRHIVALRGDPPKGEKTFTPHPQGFSCARDLVAHIARRGQFSLAVAGYPETHREAKSTDADLRYLKQKVDAGADIVITQLFFESAMYFRFIEKTSALNINVPIVPGIMPIANVAQVKRFTNLCGASIPKPLAARLADLEHEAEAVVQFGSEYAAKLCQELLDGGAPGIHFYTLNRSQQVQHVINSLTANR